MINEGLQISHKAKLKYRGIPLAVRNAIRRRAEDRCEECGTPYNLQFSHKEHRKMGGRKGKMKAIIDHEDNILLLCAYHHDVRDGRA